MKAHWLYLKYVLRHKWHVFVASRKVGNVSLLSALWHDWDKFTPQMWSAYVNNFHRNHPSEKDLKLEAINIVYTKEQAKTAFALAWNDHQKRNKHHWQYWMITWDKGNTECLEMPKEHAYEMVADWMGAGKALGKPDTLKWYTENKDSIQLHPNTRMLIERVLHENS